MTHFSSPTFVRIGIAISLVLLVVGAFIMMQTNYSPQENKADPFAEVSVEYARLQGLVDDGSLKVATLAGGCFWCMEGPFEAEEGVQQVISGFTGGEVERPTYRQVVGGGTGHRESVQIFYDPQQITFGELLEIYWRQIDPTDAGGQFADRGDMYTTAVYYHSEEQRDEALRQIEELGRSGGYDAPIVTEVLPSVEFYPAEDYHQDFYIKSSEYYKRYAKGSGRLDYIEAAEKRYQE
jgi:methionine-S-sulfoxide reductase